MIFIRRILAGLLAVVLLVVLVVVLVLFTVNDTFLNPAFYVAQLRQADIYNFLYDEALPAAQEEVSKEIQDGDLDVDIDFALVGDEAIAVARQILPPEWVQAQVEQVIQEAFPYVLGDTDEFMIAVPLADRIETAGEVIKESLRQGMAFSHLYDEVTFLAVDEVMANPEQLPFGLNPQREELIQDLRTIAPKGWLLDQADHVIDQVVPYLAGRSERFAVTIVLTDRVDVAAKVIKDMVRKGNTHDFLLQEVITPAVEENLSLVNELPFGVELTSQEVLDAHADVLSEEWVQGRLEDILDSGVGYLTGRVDALEIRVPLADRKVMALEALDRLADQKLQNFINSLPECTLEQLEPKARTLNMKPDCRPPNVTYEQAKKALGIDISQGVRQSVGEKIPDEWVFTERQLRETLGEENVEVLDQVREWLSEGISFTDADLRENLDKEEQELLDEFLDVARRGFTFTNTDLRELMEGDALNGSQNAFEQFDIPRQRGGTARRFFFVGWLFPGILLLLIGLLGGRNLGSKLTWAAATLGIIAALMFLIAGPLYTGVFRPEIDAAMRIDVDAGSTASMMEEKGIAMAKSVVSAFSGGIRNKAAVLLIIAGVGLALGIGRQVTARRRPSPEDAGLPEDISPPEDTTR